MSNKGLPEFAIDSVGTNFDGYTGLPILLRNGASQTNPTTVNKQALARTGIGGELGSTQASASGHATGDEVYVACSIAGACSGVRHSDSLSLNTTQASASGHATGDVVYVACSLAGAGSWCGARELLHPAPKTQSIHKICADHPPVEKNSSIKLLYKEASLA